MIDLMGIKVKPIKDVAVIIETLERLGVGIQRTKSLYPSAYLMKHGNDFKVMHFKEMISLDGNEVDLDDEDILRRDSIIKLLVKWGLVEITDRNWIDDFDTVFVFVLPYAEKDEWKIVHKYRRNFKIVE